MNLFKLHEDTIDHEDQDLIPFLAWDKYRNNPEELKKREKMWSRDAATAYRYARNVLKGPFPMGELTISKSTSCSCMYALYVLKGPFPLGEPAIAKDGYYSYEYARSVLKKSFPLGESIITKSMWKFNYETLFGKLNESF